MARYIDADALIADGWHLERCAPSGKLLTVMSVADVPTADVAEVKHGKWTKSSPHNRFMDCSVCGSFQDHTAFDYCPFCGAKMDG